VCVCSCGEVCAFRELKRRPRGKQTTNFTSKKKSGDAETKIGDGATDWRLFSKHAPTRIVVTKGQATIKEAFGT